MSNTEKAGVALNMHSFLNALLEGDQNNAVLLARSLRTAGVCCEDIVTDGVEAAMSQLDAKCTVEQFNLLEIMLVGRAVMSVMKELFPEGPPSSGLKGTVVLGTLEGDVHDVGKNILKIILIGQGFRVVDCGKDCPVDTLITVAEQEDALAIACSGLITTVIPQVRMLRPALADRGLDHMKVVAGGAALKQGTQENLNVDFVAENAFDGARYLNSLGGGL